MTSKNKTVVLSDDDDDDVPLNAACSSKNEDLLDNEDNIPSREECQDLTEEFATITGTDTALAQFFLQDRQWNLQKSLDAYFEGKKGGLKILKDGEQPEMVINFDKKLVSSLEKSQVTTKPPNLLKLLSWNIDGLDEVNLKKRTRAIIATIEKEKADVVFLQEVVVLTFNYMEEKLPHYMFIATSDSDYFSAIMLRRTSVYFDGHRLVDFEDSRMGRNLLIVDAHIGSCHLRLSTSHLESTADGSVQRMEQLKIAFEHLKEAPKHVNAIFGGDLNLRDHELQKIGGIPPGAVDLWEYNGGRESAKYTWDMRRNTNKSIPSNPRCRFDRLYFKEAGSSSSPLDSSINEKYGILKPRHFGLVGLEKVSNTNSYPSDHWGLITYYDIDHNASV